MIKWGNNYFVTYKLAWLWPESLLLFIYFWEQSQDVVQNCRKSVLFIMHLLVTKTSGHLIMRYEIGPDKFWLTETVRLDSVKGKCPGPQLLNQWAISNAPQLTSCSEHSLPSQEPKAKNELRKIDHAAYTGGFLRRGLWTECDLLVVRAKERVKSYCRARREQVSFPSHPVTPDTSVSPLLSQVWIPSWRPRVVLLVEQTLTTMSYCCISVFSFLDPTLGHFKT